MKKVLLFVVLIVLSNNQINASEVFESEMDIIYETIINTYDHDYIKNKKNKLGFERPIYDSVKPFKLKYCKNKKTNFTYTVIKKFGCYFAENDSGRIKVTKGKKISKKEFLKNNPNFSEENNLICIKGSDWRDPFKYYVLFLTHTLDNKIYLNSVIPAGIKNGKVFVHDTKQKGIWHHQGELNNAGSDRNLSAVFYRYYEEDTGSNWEPDISKSTGISTRITPFLFNGRYAEQLHWNNKCYSSYEYWAATYPNRSLEDLDNKSKEKKGSYENEAKNYVMYKKLTDSKEDEKKEGSKWFTKKSDTSTTVIAEGETSSVEDGKYQFINYPDEMKVKLSNTDPLRKAGTEVIFRFVKKKSTLAKYPGKLMEGMAWMEVLYNEKLKNIKSIDADDIKSLLKVRNSMRESVGLSSLDSTQDAINYLWAMGTLLSNATIEYQKVSPVIVERKDSLNELKNNLKLSKEKNIKNNVIVKNSFDEFKTEIQTAIKEYKKNIQSYSKSNDNLINSIDSVADQLEQNLSFLLTSLKDENIEAVASSIELIDATINDVNAFIPSEQIISMDNIDYEKILLPEQLEIINKTQNRKNVNLKENTEEFIENILVLEKNGFRTDKYIEDLETKSLNFNERSGPLQNYLTVKRVSMFAGGYVDGLSSYKSPTSKFGAGKIGAQGFGFKSLGQRKLQQWPYFQVYYVGSSNSNESRPLEFWETEEYKINFEKARNGQLSTNDMKDFFPEGIKKWPDGYDYVTDQVFEIKDVDNNVEWEGLNSNGTCANGLLWCSEQTDFALNELKINSDDINESFYDDLNINLSSTQNTAAINQLVDNSNSISDSVSEYNDTLSESFGNLDDSISNDVISQTVENITNTDIISESVEAISSTENLNDTFQELTDTFMDVAEQLQENATAIEEIKNDDWKQDLDDYLGNPDSLEGGYDDGLNYCQRFPMMC